MTTPEIDSRPTVDLLARKSKVLTKGDRLREVSTDEQIKQGRKWAADSPCRRRQGLRLRGHHGQGDGAPPYLLPSRGAISGS